MGIGDFFKKIVGNKAQRDMKEVSPDVERIKAAYEDIKGLTNDELRARTEILKNKIQEAVASENAQITKLKAGIEETELHLRENVYKEISVGSEIAPSNFLLFYRFAKKGLAFGDLGQLICSQKYTVFFNKFAGIYEDGYGIFLHLALNKSRL